GGLSLNAATGAITGKPVLPGSYSFTLTATDKNGCRGTQLYTIAVTSPATAQCASGSYSAGASVSTSTAPRSIAAGDFNGDGKIDFAVANQSAATVSVLLANSTGGYTSSGNFSVGATPMSVA